MLGTVPFITAEVAHTVWSLPALGAAIEFITVMEIVLLVDVLKQPLVAATILR